MGLTGAATLYFPPYRPRISTLSYQPGPPAWAVEHATQIRKAVGSKGYGNTVFSQDESQILNARATRSGGFFFDFINFGPTCFPFSIPTALNSPTPADNTLASARQRLVFLGDCIRLSPGPSAQPLGRGHGAVTLSPAGPCGKRTGCRIQWECFRPEKSAVCHHGSCTR